MTYANKGRPLTPEHRAAISRGSKGRVVTFETRAKISAALTGRPTMRVQTNEQREARSKAMSEAWADPSSNLKNIPVKGECVYCGGVAITYDHAIPRGRPGWQEPSNLVPACWTCNDSKGSRTPDEWLAAGLYGKRGA